MPPLDSDDLLKHIKDRSYNWSIPNAKEGWHLPALLWILLGDV